VAFKKVKYITRYYVYSKLDVRFSSVYMFTCMYAIVNYCVVRSYCTRGRERVQVKEKLGRHINLYYTKLYTRRTSALSRRPILECKRILTNVCL